MLPRRISFTAAFLYTVTACSGAEPASAPGDIVDDLGRTFTFHEPPERIVALVPAVTDLIVALGEGDRLVARTRFDTDPGLAHLPAVGGGLDPNIEAVVGLRPDLVIVWPSADQPLVGHLDDAGIAVYGAGSQSLEDLERHTRQLGRLLDAETQADSILLHFHDGFARISETLADVAPLTTLYVTWHNPPMTTGSGTFVDSIITVAGGRNVFHDAPGDWPHVSMEEIVKRDPDVVVLPTANPADSSTVAWIYQSPGWSDLRAVRSGRVLLIEADLFSRPGPQLVEAADQLARLLHPTAFAGGTAQ